MKHCPSRNYFCITFLLMPDDVLGCWKILADYLNQHQAMPKEFRVSQIAGHIESQQSEQRLNVAASDIGSIIESRDLTAFHFDTGHTASSVSYEFQHYHLTCRVEDRAKAPNEWGGFIEKVSTNFETIGGWQVYWPYRTWQDLRRPDAYKSGAWGELPSGFQTRYVPDKYGIGPGQTLFEKAMNPGRTKVVDHRCIFYPTAEMWLGPHFWQYAKCTKDEALAADFWLETRDTPHFTYFKCWPTPFSRPDGEQGRMQRRLWKLFFHEDCEWPPGSGTICEEPMYGPPELMPGKRGQGANS